MAQYLSLHQDNADQPPNDFVTLAAGSVGVTVRLTDGDGDQVTSAAADVSTHISFLDDGPTAPTVTVSAATVGVDETPGVQDRPRLPGRRRSGGDRYCGFDFDHVQRRGDHGCRGVCGCCQYGR